VATIPLWHEAAVTKEHDRKNFDCGEPALNQFLQNFARQSHERGAAKTFLAVDDDDQKTIYGYYSLSPASVEYARTPIIARRGLARYDIGAYRLARLATRLDLQGQGLGGQLRRHRFVDRCQKRASGGLVRQLWRHAAAGCAFIAVTATRSDGKCA
jgi:GNAT superfamily N-acetyltransferase